MSMEILIILQLFCMMLININMVIRLEKHL
nr:MAG TPA: hypothetical protein [Caudoviricetes sp.]